MDENLITQTNYLLELISKFHKLFVFQVTRMPNIFATQLTLGQMRTLRYLVEYGAMSMRDVAQHCHVAMSTTTEMANRLVRLGLIRRVPDKRDRRIIRLEVTAKGYTKLEQQSKNMRKHLRQFLNTLSTSDQDRLIKAFKTIEEILSKNLRMTR